MSTDLPTRPFTRPSSEQLVDLHVYIVPKESWNDRFRSAYNEVIHQTISCGFVRVWPELTLFNLRETILEQLGDDIPKDYVFLRSVGRCLTQVRSKQEANLKVKCFIPPLAYAPEIFILEAKHGSSSVSSSTTPHSLSEFGSSRVDSGHLSSNEERAQTNGSVEFNSEGHTAAIPKTKQQVKHAASKQKSIKNENKNINLHDNKQKKESVRKNVKTIDRKADSKIETDSKRGMTGGKTVATGDRSSTKTDGQKLVLKPGKNLKHQKQTGNSNAEKTKRVDRFNDVGTKSTAARKRIQSGKKQDSRGFPSKALDKKQMDQIADEKSLSHIKATRENRADRNVVKDKNLRSPVGSSSQFSSRQSAASYGKKTDGNKKPEGKGNIGKLENAEVFDKTHTENEQKSVREILAARKGVTPQGLQQGKAGRIGSVGENTRIGIGRDVGLGTIMESQGQVQDRLRKTTKGGHVMPKIRPAHSEKEPRLSRKTSGGQSAAAKRNTYSNTTNGDSGISDEPAADGIENADYQRQMSDSFVGNEQSASNITSRQSNRSSRQHESSRYSPTSNIASRQSVRSSRQPELSKQSSRHSPTSNIASRQSIRSGRQQESNQQSSRYSPTSNVASRQSVRSGRQESSKEASRQASRYSHRDELSRQSTQDENQELEAVPPLDLDTALEDNGLGESMDTDQDEENQEEDDMEAEMEEIRQRQAEELRLSRMRSQEMSHNRGPPSGQVSARDGTQSQADVDKLRMSREHSQDESNLLAVNQDMSGRLTQQTQAGDEDDDEGQAQEEEELECEYDGAEDAMQDLQLDEQQQDEESKDEQQEEKENKDEEGYEVEEKDPLIEECERLHGELELARARRIKLEQEREELVKKAKNSQAATQEKRHKSRDEWKKKYFEEKKKTPPLEEQVSKLRSQVDQQYRKMLSHIEGRARKGQSGPPSKKTDHKIALFKMNHEMDDLHRRVENAQIRLASEIKLRNQAENELRNLRAEVMQRKIHVSLTRSQHNLPVVSETATPASKTGKGPSRGPTRTPRNAPGRQSKINKTSYQQTTPRV